jgi:hypothetical protein
MAIDPASVASPDAGRACLRRGWLDRHAELQRRNLGAPRCPRRPDREPGWELRCLDDSTQSGNLDLGHGDYVDVWKPVICRANYQDLDDLVQGAEEVGGAIQGIGQIPQCPRCPMFVRRWTTHGLHNFVDQQPASLKVPRTATQPPRKSLFRDKWNLPKLSSQIKR